MADTPIKLPTGLLGGSFNPVHLGHVGLARWIAANAGVDSVWLSLSPSSPFKSRADLLPDDLRLRMLYAATAPYASLHVTEVELTLPRPSYTVDALRRLSQLHPDRAFRLIIGSDNVPSFCKWRCWEEIVGDFGLIIYPRPGYSFTLPQFLAPFAANITMLHGTPSFDISSTEIRRRLACGRSLEGLMDPSAEALLRSIL